MIEKMIGTFIEKYGMTGFIGILLFFVLRWVMKQAEKHTEISRDREERQNKILDNYNMQLGEHTKVSILNQAEIKKTAEFQRAEHGKMIEALDGITQTVRRINEYKK